MKMKLIALLVGMVIGAQAFAAGTLTCTAEDGSELRATVGSLQGSMPHQFSLRIRSGEFKDYHNAWAHFESSKTFVNGYQPEAVLQKLIVVDPQEGILVTIFKNQTDYSFIDQTGSYSAECEFGY